MYVKIIQLGKNCNNNCLFCNKNFSFKDDDILSIKNDIKNKQNFSQIVFTGGEPTMHKNIIELIDYAKQLDYRVIQLVTNGRLFFYNDFAKKVIDAGVTELVIPLHASSSFLHDSITQEKGSFSQTVKGILNINQFNISYYPYKSVQISIYSVIFSKNVNEVSQIIDLAERLNIKQVFFSKEKGNIPDDELDIDLFYSQFKKAVMKAKKREILCFTKNFDMEDLETFSYENYIKTQPVLQLPL